ncbi:MAG: hypothetical protein WCK29_00640 [archaeon]
MKNILFVTRRENHAAADNIFLRIAGHHDPIDSPPLEERFSATYAFSEEEVQGALRMEKYDAAIFLGLSLSERFLGHDYSTPEVKNGLETLKGLRRGEMPVYILSRSPDPIPTRLKAHVVKTNDSAFTGYLRNSILQNTNAFVCLQGFNSKKA